MQIMDPLWDSILTHAHTGDCTANNLAKINKLILTNNNCPVPDFTVALWCECILVTPQNAIQMLWNEWMLNMHCSCTGQTHYTVNAIDKCQLCKLSILEHLAIVHLEINQMNLLLQKLEIAVGMKLMVLSNIAPYASLANGSCGVVMGIILNLRESECDTATTIHKLQYPPSAILFHPLNGCAVQLQGLPPGTVPIFPQTKLFTIGSLLVKHTQFLITPAYTFTDYKAQGQTMDNVLINLAKPPTGALSPFSAYVTLS